MAVRRHFTEDGWKGLEQGVIGAGMLVSVRERHSGSSERPAMKWVAALGAIGALLVPAATARSAFTGNGGSQHQFLAAGGWIDCLWGDASLTCIAGNNLTVQPPTGAGPCNRWAIELRSTGKATVQCILKAGQLGGPFDSPPPPGTPRLKDGERKSQHRLTCTQSASTLSCTNGTHGFTLQRGGRWSIA
jgi:hypothetical protein